MKQEDFDKILTAFWQIYPHEEGWTFETELVQEGMKATIRRKGGVVVTAHKAKTGDTVESLERDAIAQAISYLPKT